MSNHNSGRPLRRRHHSASSSSPYLHPSLRNYRYSGVERLIQSFMDRLGGRLTDMETELRYAWRALDNLSQEYIRMLERMERLELLLYEQQSVMTQLVSVCGGTQLQLPPTLSDIREEFSPLALDEAISAAGESMSHMLSGIQDTEPGSDDSVALQASGAQLEAPPRRRRSRRRLSDSYYYQPDADEAFYRSLNVHHQESFSGMLMGMGGGPCESSVLDGSDNAEVYTASDYQRYRNNSPCINDDDIAELNMLSNIDLGDGNYGDNQYLSRTNSTSSFSRDDNDRYNLLVLDQDQNVFDRWNKEDNADRNDKCSPSASPSAAKRSILAAESRDDVEIATSSSPFRGPSPTGEVKSVTPPGNERYSRGVESSQLPRRRLPMRRRYYPDEASFVQHIAAASSALVHNDAFENIDGRKSPSDRFDAKQQDSRQSEELVDTNEGMKDKEMEGGKLVADNNDLMHSLSTSLSKENIISSKEKKSVKNASATGAISSVPAPKSWETIDDLSSVRTPVELDAFISSIDEHKEKNKQPEEPVYVNLATFYRPSDIEDIHDRLSEHKEDLVTKNESQNFGESSSLDEHISVSVLQSGCEEYVEEKDDVCSEEDEDVTDVSKLIGVNSSMLHKVSLAHSESTSPNTYELSPSNSIGRRRKLPNVSEISSALRTNLELANALKNSESDNTYEPVHHYTLTSYNVDALPYELAQDTFQKLASSPLSTPIIKHSEVTDDADQIKTFETICNNITKSIEHAYSPEIANTSAETGDKKDVGAVKIKTDNNIKKVNANSTTRNDGKIDKGVVEQAETLNLAFEVGGKLTYSSNLNENEKILAQNKVKRPECESEDDDFKLLGQQNEGVAIMDEADDYDDDMNRSTEIDFTQCRITANSILSKTAYIEPLDGSEECPIEHFRMIKERVSSQEHLNSVHNIDIRQDCKKDEQTQNICQIAAVEPTKNETTLLSNINLSCDKRPDVVSSSPARVDMSHRQRFSDKQKENLPKSTCKQNAASDIGSVRPARVPVEETPPPPPTTWSLPRRSSFSSFFSNISKDWKMSSSSIDSSQPGPPQQPAAPPPPKRSMSGFLIGMFRDRSNSTDSTTSKDSVCSEGGADRKMMKKYGSQIDDYFDEPLYPCPGYTTGNENFTRALLPESPTEFETVHSMTQAAKEPEQRKVIRYDPSNYLSTNSDTSRGYSPQYGESHENTDGEESKESAFCSGMSDSRQNSDKQLDRDDSIQSTESAFFSATGDLHEAIGRNEPPEASLNRSNLDVDKSHVRKYSLDSVGENDVGAEYEGEEEEEASGSEKTRSDDQHEDGDKNDDDITDNVTTVSEVLENIDSNQKQLEDAPDNRSAEDDNDTPKIIIDESHCKEANKSVSKDVSGSESQSTDDAAGPGEKPKSKWISIMVRTQYIIPLHVIEFICSFKRLHLIKIVFANS